MRLGVSPARTRWALLLASVACVLLLLLLQSSPTHSAGSAPAPRLIHASDDGVGAPLQIHNEHKNSNKPQEEDEDEADDFSDASDQFEEEPLDGATGEEVVQLPQQQQQQLGILGRLKEATKSVVAPAREYYDLVARYGKWRAEYNRLQAGAGLKPSGEPRLRNALDVMRLEYAQVDRMLLDEMCHAADVEHEPERSSYENMDFIWRVLKLLIGRLEAKLVELKGRQLENYEEVSQEYEAETRETLRQIEASTTREATERAKRIVARSTGQLAKRELIRLVELLVSDMLASYVANSSKVDENGLTTMMGRLEPFVFLLGTANRSLLVSYLSNIRFRSVLNVARSYYTALSCTAPPKSSREPGASERSSGILGGASKLLGGRRRRK